MAKWQNTIIAWRAARIRNVTITTSAAPSRNGAKNQRPVAAPPTDPTSTMPPAIAPVPPASTQVVTLVQLISLSPTAPGSVLSRTDSNNWFTLWPMMFEISTAAAHIMYGDINKDGSDDQPWIILSISARHAATNDVVINIIRKPITTPYWQDHVTLCQIRYTVVYVGGHRLHH